MTNIMEAVFAFLHMGGYAGFVWPAYVVAVVVMAGVLMFSIRAARAREAELEQLQRSRPARRRAAQTKGVGQTKGVEE